MADSASVCWIGRTVDELDGAGDVLAPDAALPVANGAPTSAASEAVASALADAVPGT